VFQPEWTVVCGNNAYIGFDFSHSPGIEGVGMAHWRGLDESILFTPKALTALPKRLRQQRQR
jgi:hypothetical protein